MSIPGLLEELMFPAGAAHVPCTIHTTSPLSFDGSQVWRYVPSAIALAFMRATASGVIAGPRAGLDVGVVPGIWVWRNCMRSAWSLNRAPPNSWPRHGPFGSLGTIAQRTIT